MTQKQFLQIVGVLLLPFVVVLYNDWLFRLMCHLGSAPGNAANGAWLFTFLTIIALLAFVFFRDVEL